MGSAFDDVLAATKRCCERFGLAKLSLDDVAAEAEVSRATLYRMFPGGKDTLLDALRQHESAAFFARVAQALDGAEELEDVLVRAVVTSTRELRADEHLAVMVAAQSGEMVRDLSVDSLPQIAAYAAAFLAPYVERHLGAEHSARLADLLSRLVVSYFLAPSAQVDLGDDESARSFLRTFILPAFHQEVVS